MWPVTHARHAAATAGAYLHSFCQRRGLPGREPEGGDDLARRMHGLATIGVGVSVSMDELAIGLVIGLLRLPALVVALLIGAQALLASQLGVRLGARLNAGLRERAEQFAGGLLIVLGAGLAVLRATGHSV